MNRTTEDAERSRHETADAAGEDARPERPDYVLERTPRAIRMADPAKRPRNVLEWWRLHNQEVTNFAVLVSVVLTLIGVIYAYYQLKSSAINFQKEYSEQQRSTAVMLVSDFFNQVGDIGIAMNSLDHADQREIYQRQLERLIVSRALLLLEELESEKQRGKVVRFLATTEYSHLFRPNFDNPEERFIRLSDVRLNDVNLAGAVLSGSLIECVDFKESRLEAVDFSHSTMLNADLSGTEIANANFSHARIRLSLLRGLSITGKPDFGAAYIEDSDFSEVELNRNVVDMILKDHAEREFGSPEERRDFALALLLSGANSLAGTKLDRGVVNALYTIVGPSTMGRILPYKPIDANAFAPRLNNLREECAA